MTVLQNPTNHYQMLVKLAIKSIPVISYPINLKFKRQNMISEIPTKALSEKIKLSPATQI